MHRERIAWIVGTVLCVVLAARLVGRVPLDEDDRSFAQLVAQVQHEVRLRYVDDIGPAKLAEMKQGAIRGMLSVLDPPYTIYVPPTRKDAFLELINGNFVGVGVVMGVNPQGEIQVTTPIAGGPAYDAGVEAGDVITHVDGEATKGMSFDQLKPRIRGEPGTAVQLTLRHYDGTVANVKVVRRDVASPTVSGYARKSDGSWDWFPDRASGIAYIRIAQFNDETGAHVHAALDEILAQGGKGLVLDLRFNGGGRLDEATEIADLFLDDGVIVSVKGRARPESVSMAHPGDTLFHGPVAVLVNGDSASASEILAGALADHGRAAVVGTRTFGKGSVQEVEDWGDEGSLKITVAKWMLPSGKSLQRTADATQWGVDPTIEVKLTDEQLATLEESLTAVVPIPPRSHATTLPDHAPDQQLDIAVKAVKTQMLSGKP